MNHFIILCICSLSAVGVQSKAAYKLKVTRTEVVNYAKDFGDGRMWITKPGRYTNAVNAEFSLYKFVKDAKITVKVYEFLSNEYKPFAINMERDLCIFMVLGYKPILYPDFVKRGSHMPEPRCPIEPGNYSFYNLTPNIDNYPPGLPFHNFMVAFGFWHRGRELGSLKLYGTLDRDAVIREQFS